MLTIVELNITCVCVGGCMYVGRLNIIKEQARMAYTIYPALLLKKRQPYACGLF